MEKDVLPPTLAIPDTLTWGGALYGLAWDFSGPIIVTATTMNGTPLPRSPDSSGTATTNSFCFPVPRGSGLGFIRVSATDSAGNTRIVFVPIR